MNKVRHSRNAWAIKDSRQVVFVLIAALYCILASLYAVLTPPWESPDEPPHYVYVAELAQRARPPLQSTVRQTKRFYLDYDYLSSNTHWFHPAVGYIPAAVVYQVLNVTAPNSLPKKIPPLNALAGAKALGPAYIFAHSNPTPFQIWGEHWGPLVIRLALIPFGLLVLGSAYRIGQILDSKDRTLGIAAAGWIAFLPQFVFISATIRNDTLANALGALVLLLAVLVQTSPSKSHHALLGILIGLGALTKYTFLYIAPVALLAVIIANLHSPRDWVKPLMFILIPAALLWGGYHLAFDEARIALAYTFSTALRIKPDTLTWDYLARIPVPLLIELFFARFGWAGVGPQAAWSRLAFGAWSVGAFATALQAKQLYQSSDANQSRRIILLMTIAWLSASIGVVRFNLSDFQPQGRYLFPALVAWSLIGFWGLWQMLTRRGKVLVTLASTTAMLTFNLYALFFTLVPTYYATPR